jgi:hypothetical protein
MEIAELIEKIRYHHRRRRYAMKLQQKIDRHLESFVRLNYTEWSVDASEDDRAKQNKIALALIAKARKGDGEPEIAHIVQSTDTAREPIDELRNQNERTMEKLARELPIFPFVHRITGAAELGLATIIAEAGNGLDAFPTPSHLWSRLGFAPFGGLAGSTWKREKWRPRALSAEEWTEHPFAGQRYALIHQIGIWLINAQVEGKEKSGTKHGRPKGDYGAIYVRRRERTDQTHPDWTPMHARMDAIRVTTKAFLKDLWCEWRRTTDPKFVNKPWEQAAE